MINMCENEWTTDDNESALCGNVAITCIRINGYWVRVCQDCKDEISQTQGK